MIKRRPAEERGHMDHGWLDTWHTFSFAGYHDPRQMGFRHLRVINEDRVQPGKGFGTHSHWDMEIVTYVLSGALEHKDSLGNGSVIRPGEVQGMSAGTGIHHSEFNASASEVVHFLQVWILPQARGLRPSYEQRAFPADGRRGRLRLVAAPLGRDGAVTLHQDVSLYDASLAAGGSVVHAIAPGRYAWLQMIRGGVSLNGEAMRAGDGAAISDEASVEIRATEPSELLLFDLA